MRKPALLLLVALFLLLSSAPFAKGAEAVVFDDPVLESVIRNVLSKPEGEIDPDELAAITELGTGFDYEENPTEGSRVKSVAVLKYCVNLTNLELHFNQITDISALAGLTNLVNLSLGGNQITDIAPLAGLTNLKGLSLFNCQAEDYSPLANLVNLDTLLLEYSTISDLTPIKNLVSLRWLSLSSAPVTDVSPLAGLTELRRLSLKDCMIGDFSPISAIIPNLTEMDFDPAHPVTAVVFHDPMLETVIRGALGIWEGNVSEPQAAKINELSFEYSSDRPAEENIYDLSDLRYCTELRQLTLINIAATDLSPLSALTKLEDLKLFMNKASDYSALSSLANLRGLDLSGSAITDLTPLAGLTNLEGLTLCYTNVSDLTPLQNLTHLFGLKLEGTPVKDYSPIAALYPNLGKCDFILPQPGIVLFIDGLLEERVRQAMNRPEGDITEAEAAAVTQLDLSQDENSEASIELLQGLDAFTGLMELNLSGNRRLRDLWPLSELTKLEKLNCRQCNIVNLQPISQLVNLRELVLGWNGSVGSLDALSGLKNLFALDAKGVGITDISGLAGLPKLQYVGLNDNLITDMSPLASVLTLTEAELKGNLTEDYSALAGIYPQLTWKDFEMIGGWQYDAATRTLLIENDSAMLPYAPDQKNIDASSRTNAPWTGYLSQIEQIVVGDSVTKISDYAFAFASALKQITLGSGVASLGERCLYKCGNWQAGENLDIIVNCSAVPALGMDVMGWTWDNPNTVLHVPKSQIDQWLKELQGGARRIEIQ